MIITYVDYPICSECCKTMDLVNENRHKLDDVTFICNTPQCGQKDHKIKIKVQRADGNRSDQ